MKATYGLNVALSNGDVFCREYETWLEAHAAFARMQRNPLCIACEVVGKEDETIADFERR